MASISTQQCQLRMSLPSTLLAAVVVACFSAFTYSLPSSQIRILLRLQAMLESPSALQAWNQYTDFCNLPPTPSLVIVCEGDTVTHLQIVGDRISPSRYRRIAGRQSTARLSSDFSSDSLASLLARFNNLRVLHLVSLGIWGPLSSKFNRLPSLQVLNLSSNFFAGTFPKRLMSLRSLHTLSVDDNLLSGPLTGQWASIQNLSTLVLSNNKLSGWLPASLFQLPNLRIVILDNNLFHGLLPKLLSNAQNLQVLSLSGNQFSGDLPDLSSLANLQALNVQKNSLGPKFPRLNQQLLYLALGNNKLQGLIPDYIGKLSQLQQLDLSSNSLSGMPPVSLFALPNIQYLSTAKNHLSGTLPPNLTLSKSMKLLDMSFNLFTGPLPRAIVSAAAEGVVLRYQRNCFFTKVQPQYPVSHCQAAALASGFNPKLHRKSAHRVHVALVAAVAVGALGLLATLAILLVFIRRRRSVEPSIMETEAILDNNSDALTSELLPTPRYISQAMTFGVLGLPQYRIFSWKELSDATNDFSSTLLLGKGRQGKVYKGQLRDGSFVAIKCLKTDYKNCSKSPSRHYELLSQLRHRHLVNLLGHCLEIEGSDPNTGRLFLVFEFVGNGSLRSRLNGKGVQDSLSWVQRLVAVTGAAKGIHFLHTGVVPGIFDNNLKATNILLDESLVSKVSNYGLSKRATSDVDAKHELRVGVHLQPDIFNRKKRPDITDVYNFGLILLETVFGRPPTVENSIDGPRIKELDVLLLEHGPRLDLIDPKILSSCMPDSITTVVEIAIKCLSEDIASRPSMEDVLWNLQYALQVQDTSSGESQDELSEASFPQSEPTKEGQNTENSGSRKFFE